MLTTGLVTCGFCGLWGKGRPGQNPLAPGSPSLELPAGWQCVIVVEPIPVCSESCGDQLLVRLRLHHRKPSTGGAVRAPRLLIN